MIVFLNFSPLEYLGGAERKVYELFQEVIKKEEVVVITADYKIAGLYGKIVLNQPFCDRSKGILKFNPDERKYITMKSLIPWTKQWKAIHLLFKQARKIYIKCDFNELILLLYFGGINSFQKTVASVRSPWIYLSPVSLMDRFHNLVYSSFLMSFFLKRLEKIHVLTDYDASLFSKNFKIKNIIIIPNYINKSSKIFISKVQKKTTFDIVFVGELIRRKGIDTVLDVIKNAPKEFVFHIIGDGPYRERVLETSKKYKNCVYHGYLPNDDVQTIMSESDLLFFPSRAEGFGGVILEAMNNGLPVVTSWEIALGLPKNIEYVLLSRETQNVLNTLNKVKEDYCKGVIKKDYIIDYCQKHFSSKENIHKMVNLIIT